MSVKTTLPRGTQLGPYTLGEPLGRGATAVVYDATDLEGRVFAVKVRQRGQNRLDRRFLREFESMRSLRLPGVVQVHHAGLEDDLLWFSMDKVDGRTFFRVIHDHKQLSQRVVMAIRLGRQLLDTLSALHDAGFIHRDVKPSNVMVDSDDKVRVLDFGIVRFFGDRDTTSAHGTEVLGTVPFMAPEQLAGLPIDRNVDLWATGIMLYEAIAGPRPRPRTTVGWIPMICLDRLVPLACLHREVPRALSSLLEKLTRVDPRERPTASDAARMLRRISAGWPSQEWPDPPFVDPGDWWQDLEGCIGHRRYPPVQILTGSTGSGRRRLAEQIHRTGVMQGVWPMHLHCRQDHVGGALEEFLQILLHSSRDDEWLRSVVGEDGETLRKMWPSVPLPGTALSEGRMPSQSEIAEAIGRTVHRTSSRRPLLLVIHDLERIDPITARALSKIAARAGRTLGMLLLHDSRWATEVSRNVVARLTAGYNAQVHQVPPLDQTVARQIASSICPKTTPPMVGPCAPQYAVEAGWQALAQWRREDFEPPDNTLWPLAVRDAPVPVEVFARLAGKQALRGPWVQHVDDGVSLASDLARRAARARLGDLRRAARQLVDAWEVELGFDDWLEDHPELLLIAGDEAAAWRPAALAAAEAEAVGRYSDARRWLFLLDTLPAPLDLDNEFAFHLAYIRARVALRTEVNAPRTSLLEACERLALTEEHELLVRLVQAEHLLREGQSRPALVTALRVSATPSAPPDVAVRALLVVIHARMALGQLIEVHRALERADEMLSRHPDQRLRVQVANWRAEWMLASHDLEACRALSQKTISRAAECRYLRGAAFSAARLGKVLRTLGKRREAEHQTRTALQGFAASGDVILDAEAELALATLLVERGDGAGARHLLDESIRKIRGLRLDHLMPMAMRVTLLTATLSGDAADANEAMDRLDTSPHTDDEAPAARVRWWRTRGDVDRALQVEGPSPDGYGRVVWDIERARAAMVGGHRDLALQLSRGASTRARQNSFAELERYALLVAGGAGADLPGWDQLLTSSGSSLNTEIYLGAIEMEARRLWAQGDVEGSRSRWRTLKLRSRELGYRPGYEEASGWLAEEPD